MGCVEKEKKKIEIDRKDTNSIPDVLMSWWIFCALALSFS